MNKTKQAAINKAGLDYIKKKKEKKMNKKNKKETKKTKGKGITTIIIIVHKANESSKQIYMAGLLTIVLAGVIFVHFL